MFEKLKKGLVLKSETYDSGEAFYTIILKNRFFFSGFNKTAILYKNWEQDFDSVEISKIINYDFRDYLNYFRAGILKLPDDEEIEILEENIKNLPKMERRRIYGRGKIKLINKLGINHDCSCDSSYGPSIQKIINISSSSNNLQEKLIS